MATTVMPPVNPTRGTAEPGGNPRHARSSNRGSATTGGLVSEGATHRGVPHQWRLYEQEGSVAVGASTLIAAGALVPATSAMAKNTKGKLCDDGVPRCTNDSINQRKIKEGYYKTTCAR